MFKFMKSKKGFTLVELMIVVVIMAILVAVAVPIFSAVTKNARTKTCLANQREIQSQLNNAEMSDLVTLAAGDTYTLTTDGEAESGAWACTAGTDNSAAIAKLFQKAPFCPVENGVINVSIEASGIGGEDDGLKITTNCGTTSEDHDA